MTIQTSALIASQREDIALAAKALHNTRAVPADRCQLALTEVRVALEIALGIISQLAERTS